MAKNVTCRDMTSKDLTFRDMISKDTPSKDTVPKDMTSTDATSGHMLYSLTSLPSLPAHKSFQSRLGNFMPQTRVFIKYFLPTSER